MLLAPWFDLQSCQFASVAVPANKLLILPSAIAKEHTTFRLGVHLYDNARKESRAGIADRAHVFKYTLPDKPLIVARQRPLNPGKNLAITVYLDSSNGLQQREGIYSIIELNDDTLLLDFMAVMHVTVYTHILQCKSFDGGDTWTEPAMSFGALIPATHRRVRFGRVYG